jgi:hypothetical protein
MRIRIHNFFYLRIQIQIQFRIQGFDEKMTYIPVVFVKEQLNFKLN